MNNIIDLNKARTFVIVVNCGTVTEAAKQLLRTQQAISLQLQQLEKELSLVLFDRRGPKITLTADGEALYEVFKPRMLEIENSVLELRLGKEQATGKIRIGCWMEQAVYYLPDIVRAFSARYPAVEFELVAGSDMEIESLLKTNQLDFGFQLFCQDRNLFLCEPIYRQPVMPVVSRKFWEKTAELNNLEDVFDIPLIDYADEYSAFNHWVKITARHWLSRARKKPRFITASNNVMIKQLVLQGIGFGYLHRDSILEELKSGELIPILSELNFADINIGIDLVYKRKNTLSFIHQMFLEFVREC